MSFAKNKASLFGSKTESSPTTLPEHNVKTDKVTTGTYRAPSSTMNSTSILKAKKCSEANECREKAFASLKTSLFQWQPDYVGAAPMFEKASNLYKEAGETDKAVDMLMEASKCYEGYNSFPSMAVSHSKAAALTKMNGDLKRSAELLKMSAEYWGLSGDLIKFGETMAKAAKEFEAVKGKDAHETYIKAISILYPDDTPLEQVCQLPATLGQIMRDAFSFLVRMRLLPEALALAVRMMTLFEGQGMESSLYKTMASITVIQLSIGDVVKAQQTLLQDHMNKTGYLHSKECELADNLIMALEHRDSSMLDKSKRSTELHYLDLEVQKLGRELQIEFVTSEYNDNDTHDDDDINTKNYDASNGNIMDVAAMYKVTLAECASSTACIDENDLCNDNTDKKTGEDENIDDNENICKDLNDIDIPSFEDYSNDNDDEEVNEKQDENKSSYECSGNTNNNDIVEEDEEDLSAFM